MVWQTDLTQRLLYNKVLNVLCNLLNTESENRVAVWVQTVCRCIYCSPPMIAWLSGSFGLAAIAHHQTEGSYHTPPRPGRDQLSKFEEQFLISAYCTTVKSQKYWSRTIVIWRPSLSGFLSHAGYTHTLFQAFSKVSSCYDIRFRLFERCLFKNVIVFVYLFLVAPGLHCWAWTFLQLRWSGTTLCCSAWLLLVQDTGSRHAGLVVELQRSRAWAQSLWHMCLIDPMHVESSLTRDQTHVSCIGR